MKNSISKDKLIAIVEKSGIDIKQLLEELPANNNVNTSRTNELLELIFLAQFVNMQMLTQVDKNIKNLNETMTLFSKDAIKLLNSK